MKGIIEIKVKIDGKRIILNEKEYNKILDNKEHLTVKEYVRKYLLKDKQDNKENERKHTLQSSQERD